MSESGSPAKWLKEARASYLQSANTKISDLEQAISALDSTPSNPDVRQRLHMLLHNLVGSGASYGFPAVSVIARRLSSALKRATDERTIIESGLVNRLRHGLDELREAFAREQAGLDK